MPEYLAPGVYVEETSFRAKSLEGIGTSTTAFVGLTRTGPTAGRPELITSFGDFERIYGGLDDLDLGDGEPPLNYLAHSVQAYFANGGSRLYVARAFQPRNADPGDGSARVTLVGAGATIVRILARFPGQTGNGRLFVREVRTRTNARALVRAPIGTVVELDGPALPARVAGGLPPFALADGQTLNITFGATNVTETIRGGQASATAATDVAEPLNLAAPSVLAVRIDGANAVDVTIAAAAYATRAAVLQAVNDALTAAGLAATASLSANRITITSARRGRGSAVNVAINADLGFTAIANSATITVRDATAVTIAELQEILGSRGRARSVDGRLEIATNGVGATQTITLGAGTAHGGLGLGAPAAGAGAFYFASEGVGAARDWTQPAGQGGAMVLPTNASDDQIAAIAARNPAVLTLAVEAVDGDGNSRSWDDLSYSRESGRYVGNILAINPTNRTDALEQPYAIEIGDEVTPFSLRTALVPDPVVVNNQVVLTGSHTVTGGHDGAVPGVQAWRDALTLLEALDDISIVAGPGHSAYAASADAAQDAIITHCERRRAYRIAVLDARAGSTTGTVRDERARIDSTRAAFYYPWVTVANPLARPGDASVPREIDLPPSGFICGIYARNDVERGVYKAPANEVVRGALRFETDVNFAENEVLNPLGVNCLRYFPGRGNRVWGARTTSSDPEWKYVNLRRYFNFLEGSIDRGTQWAVFEPNGPALWANIRETIGSFLYNEWRGGALLGDTPADAYFVRCDRTTMTQNDLDNGRLICLIGVAVVRPAEFVVFRIGQKTATARD